MSEGLHIAGAQVVNEGEIFYADVLIEDDRIVRIENKSLNTPSGYRRIQAEGKYLLPGVIDTHVHFREPGLAWKGSMKTESRAALAGGVTSIIDMPNTKPSTVDVDTLNAKCQLALSSMQTNFGFYVATTADNLERLPDLMLPYVAGVKLFYGSTTGNILLNDPEKLEKLFSLSLPLIAVHAEDEQIIQRNTEFFRNQFGDDYLQACHHPLIRSREACFVATSHLVQLASKYHARLHLLHVTTSDEVGFLEKNKSPNITAETCVHYLWFTDQDYQRLGNYIKCNPSIKTSEDRDALRRALKTGILDLISTDHAPHTREEKSTSYLKAPSGIPAVQFSLPLLLTMVHDGFFSLVDIVQWMAHRPAEIFHISERGFIREGYFADLILVDVNYSWKIRAENILYRCGWSPWMNEKIHGKIETTILNGKVVYENEKLTGLRAAQPLTFVRPLQRV